MSSPGATDHKGGGTGQDYTVDRYGNPRPADMQALPSRLRTVNPTSQYLRTAQRHSIAGPNPQAMQEGGQYGVSLPSQPRTVDRRAPIAYSTDLSPSYDPTFQSGPTLANPISQSPVNQPTPNTSPSVRSAQVSSPNYLPAVPTPSIRSTNVASPPYAYPAGTSQSGSIAPTSTGRVGTQITQGPTVGNGGQLLRRPELDDSYKLRKKGFFIRGRVLMALWSEPSGTSASRRAPSSARMSLNRDVYMVAFGQNAFCKVKRFVVVGELDRSCIALAISTHGGTGATYMQEDQSQYGLAYTDSTPPSISDSERGMQRIAIRIDRDSATSQLNHASRIHYGKLYTVEHNIRVKAYGMVNQAFLEALMSQFRQVSGPRLGFDTAPLQALREERTPPNVTSGPGQSPQRPAKPRQLLSPEHQRAMARHPLAAAGASTSTKPSRGNAQNLARPPQTNAHGRTTGPTSNTRPPEFPQGSVEDLRQRGFGEAQVRSICDMMGRGTTAQTAIIAIARGSALAQLGCNSEAAGRIAQAVLSGIPYPRVIAQYRAHEAQATQQQASEDASDGERVDSGSDAEDNNVNEDRD